MAARAETTLKLVGDTELEITRVFRAKPEVVFDAWTKPELVAQWWAPAQRARCVEVTAELKPGGKYRYVLEALPGHGFAHSGGKPFAFIGTYVELHRPSRLVYTHTFEPMAHAGHCTVTVTFTPQGTSTLLVSREVYTSAQLRKTVLETGMEHGMREAMDQLDDLVARAG